MIPYIWTTVFPLIIVQYLLPSVVARTKGVRNVQAVLADWDTLLYLADLSDSALLNQNLCANPGLQSIVWSAPFSDLPGKDDEWQHPLMWDIRTAKDQKQYRADRPLIPKNARFKVHPENHFVFIVKSNPNKPTAQSIQPNEIGGGEDLTPNESIDQSIQPGEMEMRWEDLNTHIYALDPGPENTIGGVLYFGENPNNDETMRQRKLYIRFREVQFDIPTGCGRVYGFAKNLFCP
jgi:hypothetical protein